MIPHPPALDAAYGRTVIQPWSRVLLADPDGTGRMVSPIDGTLTRDADRWPRDELTMRLPVATFPADTTRPVSPFGGTVRVDAGAYVAGALAWHTVATLDVDTVELDRPDSVITVHAVSREARVNEARFTATGQNDPGTVSAIVTGWARAALGAGLAVRNTMSNDRALPAGAYRWSAGDDPWSVVDAMLDSCGAEAVFDHLGGLMLRDVPKLGAPVVTFTGGVGGTLLGYRSRYGWAPNVVVREYAAPAPSTGPDVTIAGNWSDTDPTSPTRVDGPYGAHIRASSVRVNAASGLPAQGAADRAAASWARRELLNNRTVEVDVIPLSWVTPGDTARVTLVGGPTEDHVLVSLSFPLRQLDPMTLTTAADRDTGA